MQYLITQEEHEDLMRGMSREKYDEWLMRVRKAEDAFGKRIIGTLKPFIEGNPMLYMNSDSHLSTDIKSAFKELYAELEKYPPQAITQAKQ